MAGEWIKLTHESPDKPEIVELAGILNIDHDAAFGKCVRLWIWVDQQSVDGNDFIVTPAFIDRLTNCPGFSQGLLKVGWLKARNGKFSIPNFDRHNGQTAKGRALTKDRVKRHRNAHFVTHPLPEGEGEELKNPPDPPPPGYQKFRPILLTLFGIENPSMADDQELYQTFLDLKAKKASTAELKRRIAIYRGKYPDLPMTQRAILRNWHTLKADPKPAPTPPEDAIPDSLREEVHG